MIYLGHRPKVTVPAVGRNPDRLAIGHENFTEVVAIACRQAGLTPGTVRKTYLPGHDTSAAGTAVEHASMASGTRFAFGVVNGPSNRAPMAFYSGVEVQSVLVPLYRLPCHKVRYLDLNDRAVQKRLVALCVENLIDDRGVARAVERWEELKRRRGVAAAVWLVAGRRGLLSFSRACRAWVDFQEWDGPLGGTKAAAALAFGRLNGQFNHPALQMQKGHTFARMLFKNNPYGDKL